MESKRIIRIFMIHLWDLGELQHSILDILAKDNRYEFEDMSYTKSKPVDIHPMLIQDYVCGAMIESDIVIVLPDSDEPFMPYHLAESLSMLRFGQTSFRKNRDLHSHSVYTNELQTLMFDTCNKKPALVLGWTKESAEYLTALLKNEHGTEDTNPGRFHTMCINDIHAGENIVDKIVSIIDNNSS